MTQRIIRFNVTLAIFVLLVVCVVQAPTKTLAESPTPEATSASPDITFPDMTGPYKVGRTSYEWVDQSRDETFASVPGLKRDLMVYIWFPVTVTKRTKFAPYMDGGPMWDIWSQNPGLESKVHTHTYTSTAIDEDKPSYPVVIFDHGYDGISLNYASIIEELASHGYIVIGMSHPYSAYAVAYPDGRMTLNPNRNAINFTINIPTLLDTWTRDVMFVLDQAAKLNTSDDTFKGHLDLDHVGVLGHSAGSWNAMRLTATEPRIKAGVGLDGMGPTAPGEKPFLYVGYNAVPSAAQLTHDKYWLGIEGTDHENYSDLGLIAPLIHSAPFVTLLGTIDPARCIKILDDYIVTFFDHYLKGADLKWPTYDVAHLLSSDTLATAASTPAK